MKRHLIPLDQNRSRTRQMEDESTPRPITLILADRSHIESLQSSNLRQHALRLVKPLEDSLSAPEINAITSSSLPDTLLELLEEVIKPLFSRSQHPKLTSTGRKNLVKNQLPGSATRFLFDYDDANKPAWKNGWTGELLTYILQSFARIQDRDLRWKTLEARLYCFVPAILQMLDDMEISWKCVGCRCLSLFCEELSIARSQFLKKSGLMDVFVDALKNDFSLLPTLTPEDESLSLLVELYPAYRSLVKARFINDDGGRKGTDRGTGVSESEEHQRQTYLTLLLRHQLLHSLNHLSTGTGAGSTSSVSLSTFLISQLEWIFEDMGIASVVHLQTVLPLLMNVLTDPFATSSPQLLRKTVQAKQVIVQVCWIRVRDLWWPECFRGVIGCWMNVTDELENTKDKEIRRGSKELRKDLKVLYCLLEDVVGSDKFKEAETKVAAEEPGLGDLFDGKIEGKEANYGKKERSISKRPLISEL